MKRINICILTLLFFCTSSFAQMPAEDLKKTFDDGEYFIAYGDYQEALYNFLRITQKGVTNANLQFRIGFCYMHLDGQKKQAIPYLEEAIRSVTTEYREGNSREIQAPIEAYYYLGFAYQINHEFDKAIETYRKYITLLPSTDEVNMKFTRQQIMACQNAKKEIEANNTKKPIPVSAVNSNFNNVRPTISGDGNTLAFISQERFYDALYLTTRNDSESEWTMPRNINSEIMSDGDFYPVFLSYEGSTLLFVKEDPFNSNVFISQYNDSLSKWTQLKELNGVNSRFWESGASVSSDGNIIYFSSNRRGTLGGTDIFLIRKNETGRWDRPENLGANVNTEFNEDNPVISRDGNRLYFSSQGHPSNLGGYDIFYVERSGDGWSKPVNLGYPTNTPDNDIHFSIDQASGKIYFERMNNQQQRPRLDVYYSTF